MERRIKIIVLVTVAFIFSMGTSDANWYNNHSQNYNAAAPMFGCDDDSDGIPLIGSAPNYTSIEKISVALNNSNTSTQEHPYGTPFSVGPGNTVNCLYWDNQAPSHSMNIENAAWSNTNHTVNISASDSGGSGIASIEWARCQNASGCSSFNNGSSVSISQHGENYVTVRTTDNVGLQTISTHGPYRIDLTVPGAPLLSSPSHNPQEWTSNEDVTIDLIPTSIGPSDHESFWCFDQNNSCDPFDIAWGANLTVSNFVFAPSDGIWYFRAATRDAGGEGPVSSYEVWVDVGVPGDGVGENSVSILSHPGGDDSWSYTDIVVDLTVSDTSTANAISGIADAYYRWYSENTSPVDSCGQASASRFGGGGAEIVEGVASTTSFTYDGRHILNVCSRDGAGNQYSENYQYYNLDRHTPGAPDISVTGTSGTINDDDWIDYNNINVNIAEAGNGISSFDPVLHNTFVGPSQWSTKFCASRLSSLCIPHPEGTEILAGQLGDAVASNANISSPDGTWLDGERTIRSVSTDIGSTGKTPNIAIFGVNIDTMDPLITVNPEDRLLWADAGSPLTINVIATDPDKDGENSGVVESRYVITQDGSLSEATNNCSTGTAFSGSVDISSLADGTYWLHVCARDRAGNTVTGRWGHYRIDFTPPTVSDDYTDGGVWVRDDRTINFSAEDALSGVRRILYCEGAGCTPSNPIGGEASGPGQSPISRSLDYGPFTDTILRYMSEDWAGNTSPIGEIDIKIENDHATGQVNYKNIWTTDSADISDRLISYWARDDGAPSLTQSNIKTLRLEKRETSITANNGSIGSFPTSWSIIRNHTYGGGTPYRSPVNDVRTLPATDATIGYSYTEPFANRTAHQYRVFVEDVAGNVKWIYFTTSGLQAVVDTEGLPAAPLATLKMEFHDADADFTNLDTNLSPNGWTNITDQEVQVDFRDFGGSFLQSYTLQISDVTDTFLFNSLGTPGTWANATDRFGTLHVDRPISGETDSITFDFIGENEHAYTFRVQITDIAGNVSDWIPSTAGPIKIDTIIPDAGDVSDLSEQSPILANTDQNFVYEVDRNNGAPISEVIGNFENATTIDDNLGTNDNSTVDDDPTLTHRINRNHSVFNVDNDRVDPQGHRQYRYRIIRIEDEAGNVTQQLAGDGIIRYNYNVYANTLVPEIGTRDLNGVAAITSGTAIADASIYTLTVDLKDRHGNGIVKATGIGREVDFRIDISADSEIFLDQYTGSGSDGIFMETSDSGGFQEASLFETNPAFLSDLDFETGRPADGEYDFNYSVYTPTASWYASTDPVSDPGARYFIANFQFAVDHTLASVDTNWNTGDQSLNQGQDIEFNFGPLFTTTIEGAIEEFGFIEGANQNSNIRINKANSAVNPNAENLWLEFGIGDRLPSPLLNISVFNPDPVVLGEGNENASQYASYNIPLADGTHDFPIDSLLEMESGTTLEDLQNSYFSTHISYTLNAKDVMYNSDITGKGNYYGSQTGNNTIQGGIKVLGQTHSKKQKDIITDQEQNDIQLLGRIYKASLKKDIVKNAYTIIRNSTTNNFGSTTITNLDDINLNSGGDKLFNSSVIYYGADGTNSRVNINLANNRVVGKKTILVFGRDVYIQSDLYYGDKSADMLGIIALSDANENGGNIYIDPDVTNIVGTLFAEKSLISYDGTNELGGGTSHNILRNQLHIYGSVFSENTIGGSRNDPVLCPYYVPAGECNQDNAQKYDMNYLRRYFTHRSGADPITGNPYILPANNAKVIGGGTCPNFGVCSGGNSNYAREITNTSNDIYSPYPVIIEYNPRSQSNPAPLIQIN